MSDLQPYERFMSRVLRFGVMTSSVLMASGLLLASLQTAPVVMTERNPTLGELFRQLASGQANASGGSLAVTLMFGGLIVLMLTPFLRVVTTLAIFRAQKDWKFVGLATVVFLLLTGQVVYSLYY